VSAEKAQKKDALKLWGGRFESGPSEVFERFSFSLHFDRKLFQADILGSQAYARALARVGILKADEAQTILTRCRVFPKRMLKVRMMRTSTPSSSRGSRS
jgi:argininosuccinate lyase